MKVNVNFKKLAKRYHEAIKKIEALEKRIEKAEELKNGIRS